MPAGKGFPNVIVTLDASDRRIEQGLAYSSIANDPEVAQGADFDMLIRAPTDIIIGCIFRLLYGSAATLQGFENTIVSADGTPLNAINFNRNSARLAKTLLFQDPTVTDAGDPLIPALLLPGGTQGQNTAGGAEETLFFILKPGVNYLVRLTNTSNTDSTMSIVALLVEIEGPLSSGT